MAGLGGSSPQTPARDTVLVGQFLIESWCAVPWAGADGKVPPQDPNCPCLLGTSPRYSVVDRFGQKHWIVLNADMMRSVGGVYAVLNKWVTVTGHPWAHDATAFEMARLDVITPEAARRGNDPVLQTWLPPNAFSKVAETPSPPPPETEVRKYVTILVRFSDSLNVTPHTPDWYTALMRTTYPGMDHFTREASYNKVGIANQTVGWINLPQPMSYYMAATNGLDTTKIMTDAVPLIGSQVTWKTVWGVNIWSNSDDNSNVEYASWYQLTAQGQNRQIPITKEMGGAAQSTLGHEDGHNYGNDHSSGAYNTPYDSHWDVNSSGSTWSNLGGVLGSMAVSVHYNAYHKAKRGWIDPARIFYALPGTSKQIRIERLALPTNSTDYLMGKVYIGGYDTRYYTVEARKYAGYDAVGGIPGEAVVIHSCDELRVVTDAYGGPRMDRAAQVVDHHHTGDPNIDGMWRPGDLFSDTTNGVKIHVDSEDATGFYVTISVDANQPMPGVVGNSGDIGGGSLREALYYHAEFPNAPIPLKIPKTDKGYANGYFTIKLNSPLPTITQSNTVLDATQEASYLGVTSTKPLIMLDGSNVGQYGQGLDIAAPNCTIKGLSIGNFPSSGIWISGSAVTNTTIQGCEVGITPAGVAAPNQWDGITIEGGANHTILGGGGSGQGNVISNNVNNGVLFNDPKSISNTIQGNYIGTNLDGTKPMPNQTGLQLVGSNHNAIGGVGAGQGNVISGNSGNGLLIGGTGSFANTIYGNRIGTSPDGSKAVPNVEGLVFWNGASTNIVGGVANGQGNQLSGNVHEALSLQGPGITGTKIIGNLIGTNATGLTAVPNGGWGIALGTGVAATIIQANVVSGNANGGVVIGQKGSTGNQVIGNLVGLGKTGLPLGNLQSGIYVYGGAAANTIGGLSASTRNVVSANGDAGIFVDGIGSDGNLIRGNYVGTDPTGTKGIGNQYGIIVADGAAKTVIGGSGSGAGNIVSASTGSGIIVQNGPSTGTQIVGNIVGLDVTGKIKLGNLQWGIGLSQGIASALVQNNVVAANGGVGIGVGDPGTKLNKIVGNTVGLTKAGVAAGNTYDGIYVYNGATSNQIGGTSATDRNVVGANQNGITLSDAGTSGNTVAGNYVGTDPTGTKAVPNTYTGVGIYNGASANTIGGAGSTSGNLISGNLQNGVNVDGTKGSTGNKIQGNRIGVGAAGKALGNKQDGISLYNGAANTLVGGTATTGNVIANNANGVSVWDSSVGNTIRFNSIHDNSGLGISLSGAANHKQAYPNIGTITDGSGSATVKVQLSGTANTKYSIDFYGVVNPGAGGYGQGDYYLGTVTLTTNASGTGSASGAEVLSAGTNRISATATNTATGDTSQFSLAWTTVTLANATVSPTSVKGGVSATGTVTLTSAAPAGGTTVSLLALTADLTVPIKVVVPAGATKATFAITTKTVAASVASGFTATLAGGTRAAVLTVTP